MSDIVRTEQRPIRIAVCIPTHDNHPAMFTFDLASMLVHATGTLAVEGLIDFGLFMLKGTYVHTARESLAEQVLEAGFDFILWLDSDMRFPKDLLERLLQHGKPIVGVNYCSRGAPYRFIAIETLENEHPGEGRQLATTEESTGLAEVDAVGFGALLMKTSVLVSMLEDRPWFFYEYTEHGHTGEDVFFCQKARKHDWKIYVDQDLSKEMAHIGQFEHTVGQVARLKEDFDEVIGGDVPIEAPDSPLQLME